MNQREIAKIAKVSSATVSRVINNHPSVSLKTAARVWEAIHEHGYVQNTVARNLKTQRTQTIGFLIPDMLNPFFPAVLKGIEAVCRQRQYNLLLQNTNEDPEQERRAVNTLLTARVEGVTAVVVDVEGGQLEPLNRMNIPVAVIDRRVHRDIYDTVVIDNQAGMHAAVDYLVELGHTRIAAIHGVAYITPGKERIEGYRQALERNQLPFRSEYLVDGAFDEQQGYERMCVLLELQEPPTAVLTANNMMTMGAVRALKDRQIPVPDQMSIIGFDDFPMAAYLDPPLTVVDRPTEEMGEAAARLLFERISGTSSAEAREVCLPVKLVKRQSCGRPIAVKIV